MRIQGNKILVTGGAGAIGSVLVKELLNHECRLTVLDDLSSGYLENLPQNPQLDFIEGNICDNGVLHSAFKKKFDVVFHLAALFANENSIVHPERDLEINGRGTLKVFQACMENSVKRVVYTSSSCIYENSDEPFSEASTTHLETPYAITKLLGEQYGLFFYGHYKLPLVILRLFNCYGPGEYPGKYRNVIPNFIYRALQGKKLPITGTGAETRDFTYVEDTVRGIILAATVDDAVGQILNLGSGKDTTVLTLAETINRLTDNAADVEYLPRRTWDTIERRLASIRKARKILGYEPMITLEQGLTRTVLWFKKVVMEKKDLLDE